MQDRTLLLRRSLVVSGRLCGSAVSWNLGRAEYWVLFKGCKAEQKISRIMFDSSNMIQCIAPHLLWDGKPGEAIETRAHVEL